MTTTIKNIVLAAALVSISSFAAEASGNNNGNGCRNRCGNTSTTNGGGTGIGVGVGVGKATAVNQNNIRNTNTNLNANVNQNRNTNNVRSSNRNNNVAYGGSASSSSRSDSHSYNAGNHQSMQYNESRDRLQAPGLAASFSSTVGSPCEATPFGLGATGPGFGGLFQVPVQRGECWGERSADRLMAWGCQNAALAVLAGNSVAVALQNNPCGGTQRRAIRAKY